MPTHRLASVIAGALLAAQTLAPVALAAPAGASDNAAASLVPPIVFQNSCTRDRQEEAQAEAEGRPAQDIEATSSQSWRGAFTDYSRNGPVQPRFCWFSSQSPDDNIGPSR
jgi:hypothetical protein